MLTDALEPVARDHIVLMESVSVITMLDGLRYKHNRSHLTH